MDSALSERLERVDAIKTALRDGRPRPERLTAWYCASALADRSETAEDIAGGVRANRDAIIAQLGRSRAPTGEMRWAYAAILYARDVRVEAFLAQRAALRDMRSTSKARRKTGPLHAGGSRAALVLAACGQEAEAGARAFFEMKAALIPPWWRRSPGVTDLYSAAHAARSDDPRAVAQTRARAVEVFQSDRRSRGQKHTGARACALFEAEPRTVLKRFVSLEAARKDMKALRRRMDRAMMMEWAAQGLDVADLETIAELVEALPKHLGGVASARVRLAHLIQTRTGEGAPMGEITALSAIIAAQTAAIVAATSAATVATTAGAGS